MADSRLNVSRRSVQVPKYNIQQKTECVWKTKVSVKIKFYKPLILSVLTSSFHSRFHEYQRQLYLSLILGHYFRAACLTVTFVITNQVPICHGHKLRNSTHTSIYSISIGTSHSKCIQRICKYNSKPQNAFFAESSQKIEFSCVSIILQMPVFVFCNFFLPHTKNHVPYKMDNIADENFNIEIFMKIVYHGSKNPVNRSQFRSRDL